MPRFSERIAKVARRTAVQVESMDEPLRNARSERAGISPEAAVRLQRLAFERVTGPMC